MSGPPVIVGQPAITLRQFRTLFPEFADSSVYFDEIVQPWLNLANQQLNSVRWGSYYTMGVCLFVAHMLSLGRMSQIQAMRGGAPGFGIGMVASKAVNGVSISYNTMAGMIPGGADWNLTIYGMRFLNFARLIGAGGVQIGGTDQRSVSEADLFRTNPGPLFLGGT